MPFCCCSCSEFLQSHYTVQFSVVFFMHLLMLLFTSLYFSDSSGSNLFFLSSLLLSHRWRHLQWPKVSSSHCARQGSYWLFQLLLCWRQLPLGPCFTYNKIWQTGEWITLWIQSLVTRKTTSSSARATEWSASSAIRAKSCWRSYWTDWSHKRRRSSLKNRQISEQEGAPQSRYST